MDTQLVSFVQSSHDATQVANKIKGLILFSSSAIIYVAAQYFHITLTPDNVLQLASDLSMFGGLVWSIYGVLLHLLTYAATVRTQNTVQNA